VLELPLGPIRDLNDTSPTGVRIYNLLLQSEQKRDLSLLEEAGRLLWEQVISHPHSVVRDTLHRPFIPFPESRHVAPDIPKISPVFDGPSAE
jgi:hypothetical protein